MRIRRASPWFVSSALLIAACGSNDASSSPVLTIRSASQGIINGVKDTNTANDNVVAVWAVISDSEAGLCTGTLIAPKVLITARHCVSQMNVEGIDCSGNEVGADYPPSILKVAVGTDPMNQSYPFSAQGVKIFHANTNDLCSNDIALIVLNNNLQISKGLTPRPIRVLSAPTVGEKFTSIGYGKTSTNPYATNDTGVRYIKNNVQITARDYFEFIGTQSICQGD